MPRALLIVISAAVVALSVLIIALVTTRLPERKHRWLKWAIILNPGLTGLFAALFLASELLTDEMSTVGFVLVGLIVAAYLAHLPMFIFFLVSWRREKQL